MPFSFGFAAPLNGDTFSLDEISGWLREAGFNNVRTVDAPGLAPRLILAKNSNS